MDFEPTVSEIILGAIFVVTLIGLARLESRANLILYELQEIRRNLGMRAGPLK